MTVNNVANKLKWGESNLKSKIATEVARKVVTDRWMLLNSIWNLDPDAYIILMYGMEYDREVN